jgi:DNA-binding GntR family transcriptional regulator
MEPANISNRTHVKRYRIYSHIRRHLIGDAYLPGTHLSIDDLARRFGVSATPVREALLQLAAEQIVDFEANRGFFVKVASDTHYCDLYGIFLAFVEHQMNRLSDDGTGDIVERWEAVGLHLNELSPHDDSFARLIEEFYMSMFVGCNNLEMLSAAERILARTHRIRVAVLNDERMRSGILSDFKVIIEALRVRDWLCASQRLRIVFDRKTRYLSNGRQPDGAC